MGSVTYVECGIWRRMGIAVGGVYLRLLLHLLPLGLIPALEEILPQGRPTPQTTILNTDALGTIDRIAVVLEADVLVLEGGGGFRVGV